MDIELAAHAHDSDEFAIKAAVQLNSVAAPRDGPVSSSAVHLVALGVPRVQVALCANVDETPTPPEITVEGELGIHGDKY